MARVCEITGKRPRVGNKVSHANNKSKRKFYPNLQKKRFFIPEDGKWITLKLSTKAIKTINNKGISAVLKEAREKGMLANWFKLRTPWQRKAIAFRWYWNARNIKLLASLAWVATSLRKTARTQQSELNWRNTTPSLKNILYTKKLNNHGKESSCFIKEGGW